MPRDWKSSKCAEAWKASLKDDLDLKNVEIASEDSDTDPEEAAERDYARKNNLPPPVIAPRITDCAVAEVEKKKPCVTKVTQAKAARKARCRGVSGSMTKKQKSITHDDWDALYDDDYDFVEQDEPYEDFGKTVKEQDENDFNGLLLQDNAIQASGNGFACNKYTSETATIDAQLKRQLSLDEPSKAQLIGDDLQLKNNLAVAASDLKM